MHARGTGMSGFIEKKLYVGYNERAEWEKEHVAKLTRILIVKRGPT